MKILSVLLLSTTLASNAYAQDICVPSQNANGSRLVPAQYGSCTGSAPTSLLAKPFEVPDVPDNNNSRPRAFRLAYFYPDHTEAFYTSCSGTGLPTIRYVGPVRLCGK